MTGARDDRSGSVSAGFASRWTSTSRCVKVKETRPGCLRLLRLCRCLKYRCCWCCQVGSSATPRKGRVRNRCGLGAGRTAQIDTSLRSTDGGRLFGEVEMKLVAIHWCGSNIGGNMFRFRSRFGLGGKTGSSSTGH